MYNHKRSSLCTPPNNFDKDVQGLRDLIKMCEDLEKEQHEKADRLIKQINGENAFYWRAN